MDKIKETVDNIFMEEFEIPQEKLQENALIFQDLGMDSLDIVDLVVALEKAFQVKIKSRETLSTIKTLGDIYRFIQTEKEKISQA